MSETPNLTPDRQPPTLWSGNLREILTTAAALIVMVVSVQAYIKSEIREGVEEFRKEDERQAAKLQSLENQINTLANALGVQQALEAQDRKDIDRLKEHEK